MENEKRIFLAYRAIFDGNNAQIRQNRAIKNVVSQQCTSSRSLLQSLGEKHVLRTLKNLLERKIFESEFEARRVFPDLFTTSPAQDVQHNASEADAARSEAEALEDIASLEGDRDELPERAIDEVPSVDPNATPVQRNANSVQIPSLYPLYIPYKNQHLVLNRTQRLLEECCYNFTAQWLPDLLEQRNWDCPEALELNKWTYIVVKRSGKLPADCFETLDDPTLSLADVLISINKLRHSAVHRLPTTARGISELIRSAVRFAKVLRDSSCEAQLEELHLELEGKIRALELNKNFLETKLEQEMQDIARQRRELDEKEKEAVATMLKEDKDYGLLIGVLLSQSVDGIFDRNKTEEPVYEGMGRKQDHEAEEEHEQETDVTNETTNQVKDETPIEVEARSSYTSAEDDSYYEQRPDSRGSPWEMVQGSALDSVQVPISAPEATVEESVSPIAEAVEQEAEKPNLDDYNVPQDTHDLLGGILAREVYTAFSEAVDMKLSTYNFQTGHNIKLSDKRIRKIRRYVEKQIKIDVTMHQIELDDLIRIRFATFKAEMRPKTNFTSNKKKKSKWFAPLDLRATPRALSRDSSSPSRSPPPTEDPIVPSPFQTDPDAVAPILTTPRNPDSGTKLKTFKLIAPGDMAGPGTICMLQIREDGGVEGRLVAEGNDAVPRTAVQDLISGFEKAAGAPSRVASKMTGNGAAC